jgi:5-methylcytosine-specific restriction endonuclease McrA
MGKKRKSQFKYSLFGFSFVMITLYALIRAIISIYNELVKSLTQVQIETIVFSFVSLILAIGYIVATDKRKVQKNKNELQEKINHLSPSFDRMDYIISGNDYKRGNKKESFYRKALQLKLLSVFSNSCAKCGSHDNGIELDHFIFSKNEGGCFIMIHKENYYVNNAIPLCLSCNRSKGDRHFRKYFSDSETANILAKNIQITRYINEMYVLNESGAFINKDKLLKAS